MRRLLLALCTAVGVPSARAAVGPCRPDAGAPDDPVEDPEGGRGVTWQGSALIDSAGGELRVRPLDGPSKGRVVLRGHLTAGERESLRGHRRTWVDLRLLDASLLRLVIRTARDGDLLLARATLAPSTGPGAPFPLPGDGRGPIDPALRGGPRPRTALELVAYGRSPAAPDGLRIALGPPAGPPVPGPSWHACSSACVGAGVDERWLPGPQRQPTALVVRWLGEVATVPPGECRRITAQGRSLEVLVRRAWTSSPCPSGACGWADVSLRVVPPR